MKKKSNQSYYTNRHSCFLLCYHIVLVTKYRKPVLQGALKDTVYQIIRDIVEERGYHLIELNGEADHVHILLDAGPEMKPLELINVLKTKTARFARRDFSEALKKYYWKPYFWTDSYFIATVGENSRDVVEEYIHNQ